MWGGGGGWGVEEEVEFTLCIIYSVISLELIIIANFSVFTTSKFFNFGFSKKFKHWVSILIYILIYYI